MNNVKERGYIFQDAFSAYIISNYINRLLNGEDKFDDLKIIENDSIREIQIKYSESKSSLEWSDLKNASNNYNLYQFINSFKVSRNNKNILIIRNIFGNIGSDLEEKLSQNDENGFFSQSRSYKIKKNDEVVNELFNCRILKNGKGENQPYKNITKEDISDFIDNFIIEITDQGLEEDTFKSLLEELIKIFMTLY